MESDYILLLLNGIFLISYKKSQLGELGWWQTVLNIMKSFLPLTAIIALYTFLGAVLPNADSRAVGGIGAVAISISINVYLLLRLRRESISEQLEKVKKEKSRLKSTVTWVFILFTVFNLILLLSATTEGIAFYLPLFLTSVVTTYFLFKDPKKAVVWGYIASGLKIFERSMITLSNSDYFGLIFGVSVGLSLILLLINVKKVYGNKQGKIVESGNTEVTMREKLERAFKKDTEETNDEEDFLETAEKLGNSIRYKFAQRVLRDIALDNPDIFTDYFEKAQKRLGSNPFETLFRKLDNERDIEIKPDELRPHIRKLRDKSFLVILKMPEPEIKTEPLFIALKYEPNPKYYTLELSNNGEYVLCAWGYSEGRKLRHSYIQKDVEPDIDAFYWAISDLY